ncbi:MAG: response regulator [Candidatus Aminicenantes bacterium]|nr:response regulator [Candidatus Aminicenantes bacterium]
MYKILVVDDDKLIRWSLREIFAQEGYEVDTVATTKDALSRASNDAYHLIFADIEIDEEIGLDMLKEVNKIQPSTKIVILSAHPKYQIEPQLSTLNVFSVVEKPFNAEQMKTLVKEALD